MTGAERPGSREAEQVGGQAAGREVDQVSVSCVLNGVAAVLSGGVAEPATGALRRLGLYGVRETCSLGVCGTCTVLLDGDPVSACILPLYALEGREVLTVEGLESGGELSALQQQFIESQAFQCSFCTPGFLLSAQALLDSTEGALTDEQVAEGLQGHLCRCGCYETVKEAVHAVAARRGQSGGVAQRARPGQCGGVAEREQPELPERREGATR